VVPDGESRPRGEVFAELGVKDSRVRNFSRSGINSVKNDGQELLRPVTRQPLPEQRLLLDAAA